MWEGFFVGRILCVGRILVERILLGEGSSREDSSSVLM